MKKNSLLLILIISFTSLASAQQIVQQQYSFVGKSMATWCYPCGTWGWDLQDNIVQDNAGKAIVVELYGDANEQFLVTPTAANLVNNFGPSGSIPAWYVNGINVTSYASGGGIYPTITRTNVQGSVDSTYQLSALANSNFTYSITGDSLKVDAQTEFFNNTSGVYYLAVYIMEDNVVAPQNGQGASPGYPVTSVAHPHVLRASASKSDFGNLISNGNINAGTIFNSSFATKLNNVWKKPNIWLASVIWKRTGSINGYHYDYVNGYSNVESMTDGIKPFSGSNLQVKLMANPVSTVGQFRVSTDKTVNNISIALFDILGRQVSTIYKGGLTEGNHTYTLDPRELENGLYLLQITDGKQQYVSKLIIQK